MVCFLNITIFRIFIPPYAFDPENMQTSNGTASWIYIGQIKKKEIGLCRLISGVQKSTACHWCVCTLVSMTSSLYQRAANTAVCHSPTRILTEWKIYTSSFVLSKNLTKISWGLCFKKEKKNINIKIYQIFIFHAVLAWPVHDLI